MPLRERSPSGAARLRILILISLAVLGSIDVQPARADSDATEQRRQLEQLRALFDEGEYREVAAGAARLSAVVDSIQGEGTLLSAEILDLHVYAHLYLGEDEAADTESLIRRAIDIKERQLGANDPAVAESLRLLGVFLRQRERFDEAREQFLRAQEIHRESSPVDSLALADCLEQLGILDTEMGEYAEALDYLLETLQIAEARLSPQDPELARKLSTLARLHRRMGDFEAAVARIQQGIRIMEAIDPEHPWIAYFRNSLGTVYGDMDDLPRSLEAYEQALPLARAALGEESQLVASILNNLGVHYEALQDFQRAAEYLQSSLRISRALYGEESSLVAGVLANLAGVWLKEGRVEEAERLYEDSIATLKSSLGDEHSFVASRLVELASLRIQKGDAATALRELERALAIYERSTPKGSYEFGEVRHGIARALHGLGRSDEALREYAEVRRIYESALGPESPYLIEPLADEAFLRSELGDPIEAAKLARQSEELSRAYVRLTSRYLSEREALEFTQGRASALDLLLNQASRGIAVAEAWDQLIRSRAMVLDEMARRRAILSSAANAEARRAAQSLTAASRDYAGLLVGGPGTESANEHRKKLEDARTKLEEAQRVLAHASARFRRESSLESVGLAAVRDGLGRRSALVAYVRYPSIPSDARPGDEASWPDAYGVFLTAPDSSEPAFMPLGDAVQIDALISRWRREVTGPLRGVREAEDWKQRYDRVASELRRLLWDPLTHDLADAERIFVVPDGELHLLNWSTLPGPRGDYLLIEAPPIHYLSTERDLLLDSAPRGELLALGGVDYDGDLPSADPAVAATHRGAVSHCPAFETIRFEPLAGSRRELAAITDIWARTEGAATVQKLEGAAATEQAFCLSAAGKSVIHLATHGFVIGMDCAGTAEARGITALADLSGEEPPAQPVGQATLQLSGLALAGANRRNDASVRGFDGILTAQEIAALDLSATQWAVLSACNTGRGEIRSGEGVFGLRRAFQVAGARTLIMSLWPVDDEAAERWMTALYEARFSNSKDTMDAIRAASQRLLREREERGESTHPFYWGGFVAAGSWK